MADSIKEFLYKIGWSYDEASGKRATSGIAAVNNNAAAMQKSLNEAAAALINLGKQFQAVAGDPTKKFSEASDKIKKRNEELSKGVQRLGRFAVATATAFAVGIREVVKNYEDLYYISQRTGASVEGLQNLAFSFKQIGLSGDEATAAISTLNAKLRDNPGLNAWFRNIVRPEDTEYVKKQFGNTLKPMQEQFEAFLHAMNRQPEWLQTMFAGKFLGVTGDTMQRFRDNTDVRIKAVNDAHEAALRAGTDEQKLAEEAVVLQRTWNQLILDSGKIWNQVFGEAAPHLINIIKFLDGIVQRIQVLNKEHPGSAIAEGFAAAAASVLGVSVALKALGSLLGGIVGGSAAAGAGAAGAAAATGAGAAARGGLARLLGPLGAAIAGGFWLKGVTPPEDAKKWLDEAHKDKSAQVPKDFVKDFVWGGTNPKSYDAPAPPKFQHGGIVRADLDHGESVLPAALTAMLMRASASSGGDRGIVTVLENILAGFEAWWFGSAAYRPFVVVKKDEIGGEGDGFHGTGQDSGPGPAGSTGRRHGDPTGMSAPRPGGGRHPGTSDPKTALDLIEKYESGHRNIVNFLWGQPGRTAQGFFQIVDSTWKKYADASTFAKFHHAMDAPYDVQRKVAGNIYQAEGFSPWSNYNPQLRAAIGRNPGITSTDKNVTINQNNTVNVHGDASNGQEIGRQVIGAHRRMSGDLVRSFRTALA